MKPLVIIPIHIINNEVYKLTIFSLEYLANAIQYAGKNITVYLSGYINNEYVDKYSNYLKNYESKYKNVKFEALNRNEPHGFAENMNYAISHILDNKVQFDYILTMNNDLVVPEFIFESIETSFDKFDIVGIVSNYAMGVQVVDASSYGLNDKETISNIVEYNKASHAWRSANRNEYEKVPVLSFLCAAIKRTVIEKIGLLDERFKIGTYEDVDYTYRAYKAGFDLGIIRECYTFHFGSKTFSARNDKVNECTALNRLQFYEKYGIETDLDLNSLLKRTNLDSVYDAYMTGFDGKTFEISEHLHLLKILANSVNHVTEFGVSDGISTIALLAGRPKIMRSYDKNPWEEVKTVYDIIDDNETDYSFCVGDVLDVDIEPTDLLFIDTTHTYEQLKKELDKHSDKVSRFIVIPQTYLYGNVGEIDGTDGMIPAIKELIKTNKHWKIKRMYINCGGLIVLEKDYLYE